MRTNSASIPHHLHCPQNKYRNSMASNGICVNFSLHPQINRLLQISQRVSWSSAKKIWNFRKLHSTNDRMRKICTPRERMILSLKCWEKKIMHPWNPKHMAKWWLYECFGVAAAAAVVSIFRNSPDYITFSYRFLATFPIAFNHIFLYSIILSISSVLCLFSLHSLTVSRFKLK